MEAVLEVWRGSILYDPFWGPRIFEFRDKHHRMPTVREMQDAWYTGEVVPSVIVEELE
jgi:hypothetical protein